MSESEDLGLHGGAGSELIPEERCDEEDELTHSEMIHLSPPKGLGGMAISMLRGRSSFRDGQMAAGVAYIRNFHRELRVRL